MYTLLADDLGQFFIDFAITKEIGLEIFKDWLVKKTGLNLKANKCMLFSNDKDEILFSFNAISIPELFELLDFFKVERDSYKTQSYFALNSEYLSNTFLPQFKDEIRELAKAKKLRIYQVESQSKLEKEAISKVYYLTDSLKDELNPKTGPKNPLDKELSKQLMVLHAVTNYSGSSDHQYLEYLLDQHQLLKQFYDSHPAYQENEKLKSILKNLADFEKFNRIDLVHLVKRFKKELEIFLIHNQMSAAKCDVFEESIFRMANINEMPKHVSFDSSYPDQTRCHFNTLGMPDEDVEKLIAFFQQHGDDSAYKKVEKKTFNGDECCSSLDYSSTKQRKEDCIDVDGEFLANTIFPLFKQHILDLVKEKSLLLNPYKEQSKEYLQELAEKISTKNLPKSGFFSWRNAFADEELPELLEACADVLGS